METAPGAASGGRAPASDTNSGVLKIGDYVTLSQVEQGWLSAEGICFDDISLSQNLTTFENCLWEIHVQNQYTALREYEEVLFSTISDDSETKDDEKAIAVTDELLNQLHRAATNEGHLNTRLMSLKVGKPVLFGDIIQLRHVKSKKFLTVCPGTLAKVERENLRIHLDTYGDSRSWLEIMPKSKGDKEGQQISVHSEVVLRIHGRTSEFIHCAKSTPTGETIEVNCSLESSSWMLSGYLDAFFARSSNILAGQVVCLQEIDSTAYLAPLGDDLSESTLSRAPQVSLYNSNLIGSSSNMVGTHLLWILENSTASIGGRIGAASSTVTFKHLNTGMYLTIDPLAKSGTQSLTLNSEHTLSSDFEVVTSDALDYLHDGASVQLHSHGCWIFTPLQQSQQQNSAAPKRAHRTSSLMSTLSFEEAESPMIPSRCSGTSQKSKATSFTIHNTLHLRLGPDLFLGVEAAKILKHFVMFGRSQSCHPTNDSNMTSQIKTVLSILELLYQFLSDDILSTSSVGQDVDILQIIEKRQVMLREQGVLAAVVDLIELCGDDVVTSLLSNEKCITPSINKSFSNSKVSMKKLISQNSLGRGSPFQSNRKLLSDDERKSPMRSPSKKFLVTTLSIEARKEISRNISQEKLGPRKNPGILRARTSRANLGNLSDLDSDQFHESLEGFPVEGSSHQSNLAKRTLAHEFSTACFKTLYAIIHENHSNQMSIADKFPILLNQVKDQELAVACVQEMLRDNIQMLETKVREREISIFLHLLQQSEMNVTLLNLLRSTCSCPEGVDSTQRMVSLALFAKATPLALEYKTEPSTLNPEEKQDPIRRMNRLKPLSPLRVSLTSIPHSSLPLSPINRSILINIHLNEKHRVKTVQWTHNPLYTPDQSCHNDVFGYHLVVDGLPRLSTSWEVGEEPSMSMMHLFGFSKEVPFELLCQSLTLEPLQHKRTPDNVGNSIGSLASSSGKRTSILTSDSGLSKRSSIIGKSRVKQTKKKQKLKSISEYKVQVAEYLCSQFYLMADLCLDRNYLSMRYLELRYPYELLITILKNPASAPKLKAPVCKLIRCLYVDRDPQIEIKYPRLIRTLLSEYNMSTPVHFYLLQEIISDFLHKEFDIFSCDELSSEMLDLLLMLMKFGYFSNESQLLDIVVPLINLLDKHRAEVHEVTLHSDEKTESQYGMDEGDAIPEQSKPTWTFLSVFTMSSEANRRANSVQPFPAATEQRAPELVNDGKVQPNLVDNWKDLFKLPPLFYSSQKIICESILLKVESTVYIFMVLILVLLSTGIAIFNVTKKNVTDQDFSILIAVDLAVSVTFILELLTRMYATFVVHGEILSFLTNRYKFLDFIVVVLDISMLCYGTVSVSRSVSDLSRFTKTLRILRVLRLIRLIRAARILRKISVKSSKHPKYMTPLRYSAISEQETRSLACILKVLLIAQDRLQDKKLGELINRYSHWFDDQFQRDAVCPADIYKSLCEGLNIKFPHYFGEMLVDLLMYSDPKIVQGALQLLMCHESHEGLFIDTARKVQIISSIHLEGLYKNLVEQLQYLKIQAESIELWGELKTPGDHEVVNTIKESLERIADSTRKKVDGRKLEISHDVPVDEEVQQLLFNLDAFAVFMLLEKAVLSDGAVLVESLRDLVRACNDCIILFVQHNDTNQIVAYEQINWFLTRIDDDLYSSQVARAIIANNRNLIKQSPKSYVLQLIQMIVTQSQKSEYLDLLVGMTEVSDQGDTGIISLRSEISRYVTNQEKLKLLIQWCKGNYTPEYDLRKKAMLPYFEKDTPLLDRQLSRELQYHINFLNLLAGCKLGHKLQAVYPLEDIVSAISDSTMLYNVRRALTNLVLSLVNQKADYLEGSEAIWKYFDYSLLFFQNTREQLKAYLTKERSAFRHQFAESVSIHLKIISNFFNDFDYRIFVEQTTFESESSFLTTQRTLVDIKALLLNLRKEIFAYKSTNSVYLGPRLLSLFDETLTVLKAKLPHSFPEDEETPPDVVPLVSSRSRSFRKMPSMSADSVHEAFFRRQYQWFLEEISHNKIDYFKNAVSLFHHLPSVDDDLPSSTVRFEPLITKLCYHVRSRLERSTASVMLDRNSVRTTVWLIETWSFMVSNEIVGEEDGTSPRPKSRYQQVLNNNGVTLLCLDLIGVGIDQSLQIACLRLLSLLLRSTQGNISVQKTIFQYLSQNDSTLFFESLKDMIDQQMLWCQRISDTTAKSSTFPEVCILLDLIQGMCAGGYIDNKNIFREQHENSRIVNLLDHFATHLDLISRVDNIHCISLGISIVGTLLSLIQGPCRGNQEYFVLQTNMLASLNRILRMSLPSEHQQTLDTLKLCVLDVLLACIEGHSLSKGSVVLERIQVAIEINVLNLVLMPSSSVKQEINDTDMIVDLTPVQSKYLVFLRTIRKESTEFTFHEIVSVEVYWQHQVHQYFFQIPAIANHISESSKTKLVEKVDLSSHDVKLKDFLRFSRDLYREALHHDKLERYDISSAWDLRGYLSWIAFVSCLAVNLLLIAYYRRDQGDGNLTLPDDIELTVLILMIAQVVYAVWSVGVYVIVRTPVLYWSYADQYESPVMALLTVVSDPQLLWALAYLLFSLLALFQHYLYISICLLDFIAMNSTSRDVLNAVVYPARQLTAAIVIILIVVNIFAIVIFSKYENSYDLDGIENRSLWDSFRLVITYGVRANEGIGAYMNPNISQRMVLDMLFYFIVIVVLLNIFFGIIIDTFGKLRNLKVERESELLTKCFICGANFEEIVSQSSVSDGSSMIVFRSHREERHNLWNYLYFVLHIWHQPREKDSSLEMHVRMCIEREDVTWFPSARALPCLSDEFITHEPLDPLSSGLKSLRSEVAAIRSDLQTLFDRLEQFPSNR